MITSVDVELVPVDPIGLVVVMGAVVIPLVTPKPVALVVGVVK